MDCWRQWIRHRTASVNEYSTRYSEAISSAQTTASGSWRMQDSENKQGSGAFLAESIGKRLSEEEKTFQEHAHKTYQERLDLGVAREQARKDLPLSTYTEAYWKIDLHNLFHFLALRSDEHAQMEIRSYANVIGEKIVQHWCPLAWEAFVDYVQNAISLSSLDQAVIKDLALGDIDSAISTASSYGILEYDDNRILVANRERTELETKLSHLGFRVPW
jgi:thymidylate synthase (FAD)